jgi:DNA-binding SARP family transcriptional activator
MRFEVLGPMRISDEDESRTVTGVRQRILLAALLAHANQPLSAERLAEFVWDGAPPERAVPTLRTYVARLRRDLGPRAAARVCTRDLGYLVEVATDEVDALAFEALCQETAALLEAGDWEAAAATAASALGLWRGAALVDVPGQALRDAWLSRLDQQRVQVLEWQAEAELCLGRHEQLIPRLRGLTEQHPLREHFQAQLMLALARAGRQAEALAAYQQARRTLVDELGIEPGLELRTLHERILEGEVDAVPTPGAAPREVVPVQAAVPRQLPSAVRHFTGRQAELAMLTEVLDEAGSSGGTVVISAIDGMAGIGKTALAVHVAHRLAEKFPDGQLFLDLHGYTKGRAPRTPNEALTWLLRALGVPPERIPSDGDEAAALYRQRLFDTRTLIVLDNAATEAQVRPLLPGGGTCLVLVTSRRRLRSLDDAHSVSLDLLSPADAVALLHTVAGAGRIPADDKRLDEVAELCGYLPLALRIAASLLRHRPSWPLEHLAGQLRDQQQCVTALSDGERELAAVFDLSYASLDPPQRRLWRRLGLVPGSGIDAYAAAALMESDPSSAARLLENLVDQNLLTACAPGRYRLHDLLRAHARGLAEETDPAAERAEAVDRLLHYYAHTAQRASIPIARYSRPEPDGPAPAHAPAVADPEAARAWLRIEYANLDAAFTHAHTHRLDEHAIALAAGLAEILLVDGPFTRTLQIHRIAAETAERLGSPAAQAAALSNLGRVHYVTGDAATAGAAHAQALQAYRAVGDRLGEANALNELGRAQQAAGDYPAASATHTQALEIYRAVGDRLGEANALNDLGRVHYLTGDYPAAAEAHTRALGVARALGDRLSEAHALNDLGRARFLLGDYPGAGEAHSRALEVYRTTGNRLGEANALTNLGQVRLLTGDFPEARDAQIRALELYRALGSRLNEVNTLTKLARVQHATGDSSGSDSALTQALEIFRTLNHRHGEAYVLTELGRVRLYAGDYAGAGDVLTRALELHRALENRSNEAWALNFYAATLAATGHRPRAFELYQQALAMNRELNKPDDEAISLEGLAEHHLAAGEQAEGVAHLNQALEIYRRLGMAPDAERVQEQLDRLTTP